jgi:hypothetical protein
VTHFGFKGSLSDRDLVGRPHLNVTHTIILPIPLQEGYEWVYPNDMYTEVMMRSTWICVLSLGILFLGTPMALAQDLARCPGVSPNVAGAPSARAETDARCAPIDEPVFACTMDVRPADVVALRSDGVIGVGNKTITDDTISYEWSTFKDYNKSNFPCPNPVGVGLDVVQMCQEFLAANAPDDCSSELEDSKITVTKQAKQIRRLARENKRLRDLLKSR